MIYTLTMNPAIDLFIETTHLYPNTVNRTNYDLIQANGKGVNVSFILNQLNVKTIAMGFSGGFTGRFIEDSLQEVGIPAKFVQISGKTRINVFTQVTSENQEYKQVNRGPEVNREAQLALLEEMKALKKDDFLCISGSLPQGIQPSFLKEIAQQMAMQEVKTIIDSSYREVLDCLPFNPWLLKPNDDELAQWFNLGGPIKDDDQVIHYGQALLDKGAHQVLISQGAQGCIYMNTNTIYKVTAPNGKVVNTACAGDTLLGTFIGLYQIKEQSLETSLMRAVAAGSSTAFREGLTNFSDIEDLLKEVSIKKYK